ncbi:MAG: GH92 family glycosyl hydrolase [Terracidiphilus sp.]|nr:GH92 family glycosyl hydrolase [Terracidiphilus sp.]
MNPGLLKVQRREFLKTCAAAAASSVLPVYGLIESAEAMAAPGPQPAGKPSPRSAVQDVLPAIGTGWHGHMFPGASAPFGLVQLSPDSAGLPNRMRTGQRDNYGWDHSSGYHNTDNVIVGFSHTHVQGTGGADLGDVLVMPLVEGRNWGWEPNIPTDQGEAQIDALGLNSGWVFSGPEPGYCSFFSHEKEVMRAGFYGVHLQTPDVQAELAATTRCGMHRYRYPVLPAHTRTGVMVDLAHCLGSKIYQGELNIESNMRVTGKRGTHGWAADKQVYFVIEFARPFASVEVSVDGKTASAATGDKLSGKQIKAIFTQQPGALPLIMRVGLSCTGIEGAAKNLAAEIPHWDFDAVAHQSEQAWSRELAPLDAELPTRALSQTFFTGAYHGLTSPATFNDVDGSYRGQDRQNHPNPGFTKYTILSIWDIYRGEFPFIMLMQPKRATDIVRTLLADYKELNQNSLPMWTLWGNETWSMVGFHAAGMIVSAYVRGLRDFDAAAAYAAIRDTALVGAEAKGNRELQEAFRTLGYVPVEQMHEGAACCTLDLAYDYWCAGAMAELLGKKDDADLFYKLGQNYKNVFDTGTGFVRGKLRDGKWREPFRPDQEYLDYVETDAWQASFSVPHDVQGLIDLYGGDAPFIAKLDGLFTAPSNVIDARPDVSGMVGQDAQGNEPSNHTPYLYSFAGAPWKTQYWVRKVAALYNNTPQGIPGNDDCGQLSSWFVFAALGFYPVNAVTGVYVIGSPLVNRAALRNPVTGAKFTIVADNNSPENVFIQSVQLNGKDLTRSWITHAQILAGGELHFRMGSKPNKQWGSAPADRPPSGLLHG